MQNINLERAIQIKAGDYRQQWLDATITNISLEAVGVDEGGKTVEGISFSVRFNDGCTQRITDAFGLSKDDWRYKSRAGKEHHVKAFSKYFQDVKKGIKPFEVRFNDRDYHVGDTLVLEEINGCSFTSTSPNCLISYKYTGQVEYRRIIYVLDDADYCKDGYVILGLDNIALQGSNE